MKLDEEELQQIPALDLHNLEVISAVGRGAKGVVFLARDKASELLALKVISKSLIEKKGKNDVVNGNEYRRIFFEQEVLRRFNNPLLPRLRGALATQNVVAYAIDFCPGGNLNSLRKRQTEKMFSDEVIRYAQFITPCLDNLIFISSLRFFFFLGETLRVIFFLIAIFNLYSVQNNHNNLILL